MFYTIYQITNIINNKTYIGMHKTRKLDDGYMGSGKYLKRAINKYGLKNFKKDILFVFSGEEEMRSKEKELVTEEFCLRKDTYNLCVGGKGGFSYINRNGLKDKNQLFSNNEQKLLKAIEKSINKVKYLRHNDVEWSEYARAQRSKGQKERFTNNLGTFTGKSHSIETKQKMSEIKKITAKGNGNSQYGTIWITNGKTNRKIKAIDSIPDGFYKGRIIKSIAR